MKQKNYPVIICGHKAAMTVELFWNQALISVKFSHRKGEKLGIDLLQSQEVECIYIDEYPSYTAVRFRISTSSFQFKEDAIEHIARLFAKVYFYVNFDADMHLVTKELLTILG